MTGPTRDLRWPLPELLVDAAPGRGDNYSMPNLAHDTRQVIEALRTSILEPRDHLHIKHDRALAGRSERQLRATGNDRMR